MSGMWEKFGNIEVEIIKTCINIYTAVLFISVNNGNNANSVIYIW